MTPAYDKAMPHILEGGDRRPLICSSPRTRSELGALADAGLLEPLLTTSRNRCRSSTGPRVEILIRQPSGRSGYWSHNPDVLAAADLPPGIDGLTDPKFRSKVGFAPTNASFKSFVTGLRVVRGEDPEPATGSPSSSRTTPKFDSSGAILEAVNDGSLGARLLNHYYWVQAVAEGKASARLPSRLHFFGDGVPVRSSTLPVSRYSRVRTTRKRHSTSCGNSSPRKRRSSSPPRSANMLWLIIFHRRRGPAAADQRPKPKIDLDDLADVAGTGEACSPRWELFRRNDPAGVISIAVTVLVAPAAVPVDPGVGGGLGHRRGVAAARADRRSGGQYSPPVAVTAASVILGGSPWRCACAGVSPGMDPGCRVARHPPAVPSYVSGFAWGRMFSRIRRVSPQCLCHHGLLSAGYAPAIAVLSAAGRSAEDVARPRLRTLHLSVGDRAPAADRRRQGRSAGGAVYGERFRWSGHRPLRGVHRRDLQRLQRIRRPFPGRRLRVCAGGDRVGARVSERLARGDPTDRGAGAPAGIVGVAGRVAVATATVTVDCSRRSGR